LVNVDHGFGGQRVGFAFHFFVAFQLTVFLHFVADLITARNWFAVSGYDIFVLRKKELKSLSPGAGFSFSILVPRWRYRKNGRESLTVADENSRWSIRGGIVKLSHEKYSAAVLFANEIKKRSVDNEGWADRRYGNPDAGSACRFGTRFINGDRGLMKHPADFQR
jgi:hypothetical protein